MPDIDLDGIVIIAGNYGSGKSETAVNLAIRRKQDGLDVRIADLDLVNPYFRTREAIKPLTLRGIDVVLPDRKYFYADLPILTPEVVGMIRKPTDLVILDAGGDDVGATVLSAIHDALKVAPHRMIQVVNPFRPFTETVEGCIRIKEEIEKASRLTITGVVSNANLIDLTTQETIYKGYELVRRLSDQTGLTLEFITAPADLIPGLDLTAIDCPILPISRTLVPPWKKSFGLEGVS